jgi:hypothetical protein
MEWRRGFLFGQDFRNDVLGQVILVILDANHLHALEYTAHQARALVAEKVKATAAFEVVQ